MLDCGAAELVIQAYGENGGRAGLILGGLATDPVVDVPGEVVLLISGSLVSTEFRLKVKK